MIPSLKQIRERRAACHKEMGSILARAQAENRDVTNEELVQYEELDSEFNRLTEQQTRAENWSSRDEALAAPRPSVTQGQPVIGQPRGAGFETLGEFLHAVAFRPTDPRLQFVNYDVRAEQRMDTGSAGGFAIPNQFLPMFMQVAPQDAIILPRARRLPIGTPPDAGVSLPALDQTGTAPHNMFGGVRTGWGGEGHTKQETDAKLREITLQPHELAAYIPTTEKLLRNWREASDVLASLLRGASVAEQDRQFLIGSGVGRPLGLVHSGAALTVPRATASRIQLGDILTLRAGLLEQPGGAPIWIASTRVRAELYALRNYSADSPPLGDGALVVQPSLTVGEPDMMLGLPLLWSTELPALGSKGDLVLVDPQMYLVKPGSGPFIEVGHTDDQFIKNKITIKITFNVDGRPWLTAPIEMPNGQMQSGFNVLDVVAG